MIFLLFLLVISTRLVKGSCPSNCSCRNDASGTFLNCNSKLLLHIPNLPGDTYELNLAQNRITYINVQFCKEMPQLQYLYIHYNEISEIPVNTFVECGLLKTIYLHHNKIRSIESNTFVYMANLNNLYLHNNEISTIEQFSFTNLPSLRYLYIYYNKIISLKSNTFTNMTNLYELYMHNNEISAIEPFPFVNLPSLYYLYLQNNFIQSLESNTFVNMTNLYELDLSGNNISHIEEHAFWNLTSLSALHLTSNPINCDCSIYPFWSWLVERALIGTSAKCNDGRFVISLRSSALEKCNPDNCKCFNGGTCVTKETGLVICDCIGQWTGEFCQDSQCISHNCGFGDCFIEPMNGTAQCVFDDTYINNCPEISVNICTHGLCLIAKILLRIKGYKTIKFLRAYWCNKGGLPYMCISLGSRRRAKQTHYQSHDI